MRSPLQHTVLHIEQMAQKDVKVKKPLNILVYTVARNVAWIGQFVLLTAENWKVFEQ